MDVLKKPHKALRKFVHRVSIQTLAKNSDGEEVEPYGITRGSSRAWAEPTQVDLHDPKNWRAWKKDFAFVSLLVTTAVVGILKTLFITTNSTIAAEHNVSYTAAAALTGVPFMVAPLSSLGSAVLSQVIGKRPIHLGATLLMLAGTVWNMHVAGSYLQFMFARLFQGVGWGAFDGIVMISIRDIFYPHELPLCFNVISITSFFFTWASPILSGYLSQGSSSFRAQLLVVNIIQAGSVFFSLLFFPEPSFKRSNTHPERGALPSAPSYISSLSLLPYSEPFTRKALQSIRALATPSALLGFLLVGPLTASAFGLSNSLSLLFTSIPVLLFPTQLGLLFILPAILCVAGITIITIITSLFHASLPTYRLVAPGMIIGIAGLLSFGLYTSMAFNSKDQTNALSFEGIFARDGKTSFGLNLPTVSLLLALLVTGVGIVGTALRLYLGSTSCQTSQAIAEVRDKELTDIERASRAWIDILSGVLIIAIPAFASSQQGAGAMAWLKDVVITMAVIQILACLIAGFVTWLKIAKVKTMDAKVLGKDRGMDDAREGSFLTV